MSHKLRNDVSVYKASELEATFIEICNPKKIDVLIKSICKHRNIDIKEFKDDYFNEVVEDMKKCSRYQL